jgi:tetratricopeptide (TPR) repeat protein
MSNPVVLDPVLVSAVSAKRAVLFLGAGASLGATRADGHKIPDAAGLGRLLSSEFLNSQYDNADFKTIYDFSCSTRSVRDVQDFVHKTLSGYNPAPFHLLVPKFAWAGIATTNYDLILEAAYNSTDDTLQHLFPNCKDGDGVPETLGINGLLYVKLHGCITHYQYVSPPMVASTEQIIQHKEGRAGQFAQFLEWAKTRTIIFAGYGLGDFNLRALFHEIAREGDNHPRHFIVRPGILKAEADYWQDRRARTISATFEQFLNALSVAIPEPTRKLALTPSATIVSSFTRFIARARVTESEALLRYFNTQCEHVSDSTIAGKGEAARFYRGFDLGWYPFANDLDVPRRVTKDIMDERVAPPAIHTPQLVVIKGHAGGGKSVMIRRIAWDAAHRFGRLVFRVRGGSALDRDMFEEIVSLTNQPIYLLVDDVADDVDQTVAFYNYALRQKWPIVIIAGVRIHEWNVRCEDLAPFVDEEYELHYLSNHEIELLLGNLEKFDALGHLKSLNLDTRKIKLREIYGRQLLVALYEATENATFRDIITDEFRDIKPAEAKLLYLDICSLNRFGPPVRAGLISRIHGIDFDDFRTRFFKPLEQVVDLIMDSKTQDWTYKARHSVIADIVYDIGLPTVADKYDNLMRIIGKLNPSYSYDQEVLFQLIKASPLAELFPDVVMGNSVYGAALSAFGELSVVVHQHGIYEMRRAGDTASLDRAEILLERSLLLSPGNPSIKHSLAELALKRSSLAVNEADRETWRVRSENQARALISGSRNSYPSHTLAKLAIARVRDALEKNEGEDNELTREVFGTAVKEAEDVIRDGLKKFPNDDRLLSEEATLGEILQNADRSLKALKQAAKSNPRSELIARRLARILRSKGQFGEAIHVIRSTLDLIPGSQTLHYDLAQTLMESSPGADVQNGDTVLYHLQRSFSGGDKNNEARFWYARQLCLVSRGEEAVKLFAVTKTARVPYGQRRGIRGIIRATDGTIAVYYGQLYAKKALFGFVRSDQDGLELFISQDQLPGWDAIMTGQRISYNMGFNLQGPVAINGSPT